MTQKELAELRARNDAIFKAQNEEWEKEKLEIKNNKKIEKNQGIENKSNSTNNSNKGENVDVFFVGIQDIEDSIDSNLWVEIINHYYEGILVIDINFINQI